MSQISGFSSPLSFYVTSLSHQPSFACLEAETIELPSFTSGFPFLSFPIQQASSMTFPGAPEYHCSLMLFPQSALSDLLVASAPLLLQAWVPSPSHSPLPWDSSPQSPNMLMEVPTLCTLNGLLNAYKNQMISLPPKALHSWFRRISAFISSTCLDEAQALGTSR